MYIQPMDLKKAVIETLAYSDMFDHPLTVEELHRFLVVSAAKEEIESCVSGMGNVFCRDGYYFLAGRDAIVEIRKTREANSRKAFRRAISYGRILGILPFVRMAALTGSLAMLNLSKNRDMDYLIVARSGRVWTARAFALLFGRMANLLGDVICPNVIVSERALAWDTKNIYTAREFAQMIPISGADIHLQLREANLWVLDMLPNSNGNVILGEAKGLQIWKMFQTFLEALLDNSLGGFLETWEMNRKIARLKNQKGYGVETNFTTDICQGNFDHHGSWAMDKYRQRLNQIGIE
jgi:hypothetical protein